MKFIVYFLLTVNLFSQHIESIIKPPKTSEQSIYYVDNVSGNDSYDGKSTTGAWKTLSKVNSATYTNNSIIKFKSGGVWKGQINVNHSKLSFDCYGTGNKPIIYGSDTLSGWLNVPGESSSTNYSYWGDSTNTTTANLLADFIYAKRVTTGANGGVFQGFRIYAGGDASNMHFKFSLYTNDVLNDRPGTLIANTTTNELTATTASTKMTYAVSNGTTLQANTTYWICYNGSALVTTLNRSSSAGTDTTYTVANSYSGGFPSTCPSGGTHSAQVKWAWGLILTKTTTTTSNLFYKTPYTTNPSRLYTSEKVAGTKVTNKILVNSSNKWCWSGDTLYTYNDTTDIEAYIYKGIYNHGYSNLKVRNLEFRKCLAGIALDSSACSGFLGECNTFNDCYHAIDFITGKIPSPIVQRNHFTKNDVAFYNSNSVNTKFRYNTLWDNGMPDTYSCVYGVNSDSSNIYNNSHYIGTVSASPIQVFIASGSLGNNFRNNSLVKDDSSSVFLKLANTSGNGIIDYNNYSSPYPKWTYGTTNYTTFSAWKTAIGQDSHSLNQDPAYIGNEDFHLMPGSPNINSGIMIDNTLDKDLKAINGPPDIGAYEYMQSIQLPPDAPVNLAASSDSTIANLTWSNPSGIDSVEVYLSYNNSTFIKVTTLSDVENYTYTSLQTSSTISKPLAVTTDASNVANTTATINGYVTPNNGAGSTTVRFLYGQSSLTDSTTYTVNPYKAKVSYWKLKSKNAYGTSNYSDVAVATVDSNKLDFSKNLTSLSSGTQYRYKIIAQNSGGRSDGGLKYFTTTGGGTQTADYYVNSVSGNDSNTGKDTLHAWKTLAKVSSMTFTAGDTIRFHRGQTFSGKLKITTSHGTVSNRIVFGAYSDGSMPVITPYIPITSWTQIRTNVWRTSPVPTGMTNVFSRLRVNNIEYSWAADTIQANRIYNTDPALKSYPPDTTYGFGPINRYFVDNTNNYVYLYSTTNPNTLSVTHNNHNQNYTVGIGDCDYITMEDLAIEGSRAAIALLGADHFKIQRCTIGRGCVGSGMKSGAGAADLPNSDKTTDSVEVINNIIDSGFGDIYFFCRTLENRCHNSASNGLNIYASGDYDAGSNYWTIDGNTFHNWHHTCVEMYALNSRNSSNHTVTRNYAYADGAMTSSRFSAIWTTNASWGQNIKIMRNYIKGMTQPEEIDGVDAIYAYNIYDRMGIDRRWSSGTTQPVGWVEYASANANYPFQDMTTSPNVNKHIQIMNNTFYYTGGAIRIDQPAIDSTVFKNNLLIDFGHSHVPPDGNASPASSDLYYVRIGRTSNYVMVNNLIVDPGWTSGETNIYYNGGARTIAYWNSITGAGNRYGGNKGIPGTLSNICVGSGVDYTKFQPLNDATNIINKGESNGLTKDFYGNTISGRPDIGAIEYQAGGYPANMWVNP